MTLIGIIGGSGLDNPGMIENPKDISVDTPYGDPSSPVSTGKISGTAVAILARHGRNHELSPSQVNYRANIYALKEIGCTHILATTACGSLREEIGRGDFVLLDQFIDFTRHRKTTFFDSFENETSHTSMADPFDDHLRTLLYDASVGLDLPVHRTGTVITIEGPRFSTRAESNMYRVWGADVVNMSIAPEAILANEAKIPYAAIAMSTDYDCWKEDEAPVTWDEILDVFHKNADNVQRLLINVISKLTQG